jgi:hypothetical protein
MKIISTIIVFAMLLSSSIGTAVCIEGNRSIKQEYDDSKIVFIGRVLNKKDVPESDGYYEGEESTVQVKEVFKGKLNNKIIIFSENSSGRFPMAVGATYIMFLYYESGRYQIDNCGNSGLLSEKQSTVKSVRQLLETMIK